MRPSRSSTLKMMLDQAPKDRQIETIPAPFVTNVSPYKLTDFRPCVKEACQTNQLIAAGLKIAKAIVVGNVAVGKSSLVNRFCHSVFDSNYKTTIGVDFEVERFDVLQVPFNLQIWDTAGQERFKCIASSYYRGAHVIIVVFDVTDLYSLSSCPKWLEDALKANVVRPLVFLVGTKRDLLSDAAYKNVEQQAVRMSQALQAEFWSLSSKSGLNVDNFFRRVAALTFDLTVANEFDEAGLTSKQIGQGLTLKRNDEMQVDKRPKKFNCCN